MAKVVKDMSYSDIPKKRRPKTHTGKKIVIHVVCIFLSLLSILPFWVMIVNSTRSTPEIQQHALSLIPSTHMAKNFDILTTQIGAGARYYFESCGIYLGALAKYAHVKDKTSDLGISFRDFRPEAHVGYCFFLGRHVTLDPEVYYEHSFKNSDYSGFGLRIGIGIYF